MRKEVLIVVTLLVLFVSVSFVSAGLLDWFKGVFEDGDLKAEIKLSPEFPGGLAIYYKFQDDFRDSVGFAERFIEGDPKFVSGKIGQAVEFDGVDDHVIVSNHGALDIGGKDYSSAVWIYPREVGNVDANEAIFWKGDISVVNEQQYGLSWHSTVIACRIGDENTFFSAIAEKTFGAKTDLFHLIGREDQGGWSANTAEDEIGFLSYGPYTTEISGGENIVNFRFMVDNNVADNHPVVNIDVYDATNDKVLIERTITRQEFNAPFVYQDFELGFNSIDGNQMEFRTYWYDTSYVRQEGVRLPITTSGLLNDWHHVACTYDGSNFKIYVDGELSGTTPTSISIAKRADPLFIGDAGLNDVPRGRYFNGLVDELKIWDKVLSADEIRKDYEGIEETICTDSDGGTDFFKKGYTCVGEDCSMDQCDPQIEGGLNEGYCKEGARNVENYNCPNGCQDGACVVVETCTETGETKVMNKGVPEIVNGLTVELVQFRESLPSYASIRVEGITYRNFLVTSNMPSTEIKINDKFYTLELVSVSNAIVTIKISNCEVFEENIGVCTDSDSGQNYNVKGIVTTGSGYTVRDGCTGGGIALNERYCDPSTGGGWNSIIFMCDNGCVEGICVNGGGRYGECHDSDGGINIYVKGSVRSEGWQGGTDCCSMGPGKGCSKDGIGDYVGEVFCAPRGRVRSGTHKCPNGCVDGACVRGKEDNENDAVCTDSDGGLDYSVKGNVCVGEDCKSDICTISSSRINLDSDKPSETIIIADGSIYSIELVSTSDTSATIKVRSNDTGESQSKEISEGQSKIINGITITVITAEETNIRLSSTVVVGIGSPSYNLKEYHCQSDFDRADENYYCPNGCKDGACLIDGSNDSTSRGFGTEDSSNEEVDDSKSLLQRWADWFKGLFG